ncbi:MAG: glycosyltransferase family 39 protein [Anaerolineae bacterium]|nr:glycosyltransferase family 39 protein [Anaerolineae bacterium]
MSDSETSLPVDEAGSDGAPAGAETRFEDLTLAEMFGQLLRAPRMTWQALRAVVTTPRRAPLRAVAAPTMRPAPVSAEYDPRVRRVPRANSRAMRVFMLRIVAFLVAWWGCGILANTPRRTETTALDAGAPFLILGFVIWLAAEWYGDWPRIREWWARRGQPQSLAEKSVRADTPDEMASQEKAWTGVHPRRVLAGLTGLFLSLIAWRFTANNQFTFIGFWSWMVSIILWVIALAPDRDGPLRWVRGMWIRVRHIHWRSGTVLALAAIMLLGVAFRLSDLQNVPPEMTSDHVEKILDSYHVLQGQYNVFFANNGGREPAQMYAMALFAQLPGLGFNHVTLKLLSAVEGLIAILLLYWMGREVVGEENRRLGNLVGLTLAALVAASYWHTMLSRLGLRIILTTLVTAALLVFLARAMRHNRRADFIKAGLVLGFGLYTYQAVRMLPVVIVVGVVMAFLFRARGLRAHGRTILNLIVLVLIAFVVFVPMFGYWLQYPDDFWRRTQGRLLGDDIIQTTDEQGNTVERHATLVERWDAFQQNLPILTNNIRTALLMFNWKGDVAWINGAPNEPTMDSFSGALLIVGLAAWLARMLRRRDVFDWLVPLALVIMLMPSALSIAYPVENPSHTRTSGALPEAYLIAALPLALLAQSLVELVPGRRGVIAATGLAVVVVLGSYTQNTRTYFVGHDEAYLDSSFPYSEAGRVLRGFAESDGSYGNAFMVGFPHWWDHRALGIDSGRPDWPNGIVSMDNLRDFLLTAYQKTDEFRLDPDKDLLFFLAAEDEDTLARLELQFPNGRVTLRQSYQVDDQYGLYRVPALGEAGFLEWAAIGASG